MPDLPPPSALLPYLERVQENRWYSNFGPLLLEYETRLSELTGAAALGGECVTLSSATAALELGMTALELPRGSPVLLPAFTFPATLLAVLRCGLEPVLCDVCPETWTLTPEIARACFAYRPCSLVIPVAAFGLPLPADKWDRFASETGVSVLLDAAAALGRQKVGSAANAVFSLHATKPLGVGEGGLFATADRLLAERVRRLSNFGFQEGIVAYSGATNAKLSEYAAAVGLAQLERWPQLSRRRKEAWSAFRSRLRELADVKLQGGLEQHPPATVSAWMRRDAASVADSLAAAGIETRRWYFPPLHRHSSFATIQTIGPEGSAALPVTEDLAARTLGLPFHTSLREEDFSRIISALRAATET